MIQPITSVKVTCISKNLQGVEDEIYIKRDVVELIRESSVITALTVLFDSMQATAPRPRVIRPLEHLAFAFGSI